MKSFEFITEDVNIRRVKDALSWLVAYIEQSWSIDKKFMRVPFVIKLLAPIIREVSYVPANRRLYRVIASDHELQIGQNLSLGKNSVISFTYLNQKSDLTALADQVGAADGNYCYAVELVSSVNELFNVEWIYKKLIPWAIKLKNDDLYNVIRELELNEGYRWQKEVVVFSKSPIITKVIAQL